MKKESASWNVAATHFLTAGFAIPLVLRLLYVFLGVFVFTMFGDSDAVAILYGVLWYPLVIAGIWLGVRYSAGYVKKKYIVTNAAKVVKLSTIYAALVYFLIIPASLAVLLSSESNVGQHIQNLANVILYAVVIFLFYQTSKKYIQGDISSTEPETVVTENIQRQ